VSKNTPGKYYVNDNCIAAKCCLAAAPENFAMDDNGRYSYVKKQPTTPEEETDVIAAVDACPVAAIKDDSNR